MKIYFQVSENFDQALLFSVGALNPLKFGNYCGNVTMVMFRHYISWNITRKSLKHVPQNRRHLNTVDDFWYSTQMFNASTHLVECQPATFLTMVALMVVFTVKCVTAVERDQTIKILMIATSDKIS